MSRLDLRVGRLGGARRHPLAAALTVQDVDVGEEVPRAVVSAGGEKVQMEEVAPPDDVIGGSLSRVLFK